jgi:hypothetical protein
LKDGAINVIIENLVQNTRKFETCESRQLQYLKRKINIKIAFEKFLNERK